MAGIDSFVVTNLHMDTDFSDSSTANPKTWTAQGGAATSALLSEFGGGSGLFVSALTSYLTCPDSNDFYFDADFTVDFWMYPASTSAVYQLYSQFASSTSFFKITTFKQNAGDIWVYIANGAGELLFRTSSGVLTANAWQHIAIVRNGNTWYIFVGGVSKALTLVQGSYSQAFPDISGSASIGARNDGQDLYSGNLDEFRISKGIARYTADFTPATSAYSAASSSTATPTLKLITVKINSAITVVSNNAIALPSTDIVKLIVNSPTIKITNSSTASPSSCLIKININAAMASTGENIQVLANTANVSVIVNTPIVQVHQSASISVSVCTVKVLINIANASVQIYKQIIPQTVIASVSINSPKIIISSTGKPSTCIARIIVNSPQVSTSVNRQINVNKSLIQIFINSPTLKVNSSRFINVNPSLISIRMGIATIQVSKISGISRKISAISRIDKYMNNSSAVKK